MGNTGSEPQAALQSQGAAQCVICSIAAHTVHSSNEIHVQRGLWQKWKDFNNHFNYYIYRVNFHYIICVQRPDTGDSLAIDLIVNQATKTWHVRVREVEWRPGKWTVHKSKHTWHAAAALNAVHSFAKDFDKWSIIGNNCISFVKGVVGFMADTDKRAEYECEPITDDFDKLSSFGAKIGVELMYMTSKEAVKEIPTPEEGEEEQWKDESGADAAAVVTGGKQECDGKQIVTTQGQQEDTTFTSYGSMEMIEKMNNK